MKVLKNTFCAAVDGTDKAPLAAVCEGPNADLAGAEFVEPAKVLARPTAIEVLLKAVVFGSGTAAEIRRSRAAAARGPARRAVVARSELRGSERLAESASWCTPMRYARRRRAGRGREGTRTD
jgi:transposase